MALYRLVPIIDTTTTVQVAKTSERGYTTYGKIHLEPDKVYTTDGDVALENSLRNFRSKKVYTKQLEDVLTKNNIPFEVKVCPACGGKKKNIFYNPVEVYEE